MIFLSIFALVGLITGFLAGMLGIGGGMILTPILSFYFSNHQGLPIDLSIKMAIASSMATIIFTSLANIKAHFARRTIRWDLVKKITPGILVGTLLGSLGFFSVVKGKWLAILFFVFLMYSATQMFLDKKPNPTSSPPISSELPWVGLIIGFLSSLVGAGGAFATVPYLLWRNIPLLEAIASSATLGFPIALLSSIGYVVTGLGISGRPDSALGYIDVYVVLALSITSTMTPRFGAATAHALPVKTLRKCFAVILYFLAFYMLYKGLSTV